MTLLLKPAMLECLPGPESLVDVHAEQPADQVPRLNAQGVPLLPWLLVVALRHPKHENGHPMNLFTLMYLQVLIKGYLSHEQGVQDCADPPQINFLTIIN
jgi:hypothetical protein